MKNTYYIGKFDGYNVLYCEETKSYILDTEGDPVASEEYSLKEIFQTNDEEEIFEEASLHIAETEEIIELLEASSGFKNWVAMKEIENLSKIEVDVMGNGLLKATEIFGWHRTSSGDLYAELAVTDDNSLIGWDDGCNSWVQIWNDAEELGFVAPNIESNLKKARIKSGMTQKAIADMYDVPLRTWEDWEAGRRNPPSYAIKRPIEALNYLKPEQIYVNAVIDDTGKADIFVTECKTREEAINEARNEWERLTRFEKKGRRISAGMVIKEKDEDGEYYLQVDAFDEYVVFQA